MTTHTRATNGEDPQSAIRRELEAARERIDSLTVTLHDVQARLERKHLALLQSRAGGKPVAQQARDIQSTSQARIHLLEVKELQPHCHLDFLVEGLLLSDPTASPLRFRLVHHLGHPGIALLCTDSTHVPLTAWRTSGSENGMAFMLLMPSDPAIRAQMRSLGTTDWRLLRRLAAVVHGQLQIGDWHVGPWWTDVAARLRSELDAFPDVLRFDAAAVEWTDPGFGCLAVRLIRAEFGRVDLGEINLRWSPGDGLHWLRLGDAALLPLSHWNFDPQGKLTPALKLPLGRGTSIRERLRFWRRLTLHERTLLRTLVEALSRISVARAAGDAGPATSHLMSLVADLQRQVRTLVAYDDLRALLGGSWT